MDFDYLSINNMKFNKNNEVLYLYITVQNIH